MPVAKVVRVDKQADTAFARVVCLPVAPVRGARQLLVLHYQNTSRRPEEAGCGRSAKEAKANKGAKKKPRTKAPGAEPASAAAAAAAAKPASAATPVSAAAKKRTAERKQASEKSGGRTLPLKKAGLPLDPGHRKAAARPESGRRKPATGGIDDEPPAIHPAAGQPVLHLVQPGRRVPAEPDAVGRLIGVPDFVALVLLFWNVHQPRKVGMGIAFLLGMLMDVHNASLLGEHALAYTLLSYGAITIHRRVLWMSMPRADVRRDAFVVGAQLVPFVIRLLTGAAFPGWGYLIDGFVEAAVAARKCLLLMPQRRPADPDDTRPI
jgi:rod shape-determining protein MreD